jgi:hypothetical protein
VEDDTRLFVLCFSHLHLRIIGQNFRRISCSGDAECGKLPARYIVTHPATGNFDCEAGKKYLKQLKQRRIGEIEMLAYLTGKGYNDWDVVVNDKDENLVPLEATYATVAKSIRNNPVQNNRLWFAAIGFMGIISVVGLRRLNQ